MGYTTCIIFNPAARGDKARGFRKHLDDLAAHAVLKPTVTAGNARTLAAEAVREGFEVVVAAGGDGTVNEGARSLRGEFIIVGNGRFYGGAWALCPNAAWDDGLLEVTVFKRRTVETFLRGACAILVNRLHSLGGVQYLRAPALEFTSASPAPVQVDGEYAGTTPARGSQRPRTLR